MTDEDSLATYMTGRGLMSQAADKASKDHRRHTKYPPAPQTIHMKVTNCIMLVTDSINPTLLAFFTIAFFITKRTIHLIHGGAVQSHGLYRAWTWHSRVTRRQLGRHSLSPRGNGPLALARCSSPFARRLFATTIRCSHFLYILFTLR